jgi:HD-like signal output (HDOD) protein
VTATNLKSHILRSLVKLPPMPQVILKAREVIADPNAGLRDLARIIESDQALVARVLALANSAYYGISGQVSTIQHASVLLGLNTLGDLIIMSASSVLLNRALPGYGLDPKRIWLHSLSTALCARLIAERHQPGAEADAFVVGLLHDAGKIILDPFVQKQKETQESALPPEPGPLSALQERERLGVDHAEVMAMACRFWRFPEAQIKAIRFHHQPADPSGSLLACTAHLANVLSHRAGFAGEVGAAHEPEEAALQALRLSPQELDELQAPAAEALHRLEEAFPSG